MKNKYAKRIIGIALICVIVTVFVSVMQSTVTNRGDSDYRALRSFYMEKPDTLDAVVMGSSEVMSGYCAAEAYRTAGYTSFPYAFSINSVLLWKYELEDIERTQHPDTLIIETNGALYSEDKYLYSKYCISALGDSMPMSLNRIRMAFDMSEEPLERLIPFIKYHYKWKDILKLSSNNNYMLLKQGHARLRGVNSRLYRTKYSSKMKYPPDGSTAELNANAEKALIEFLDICKTSEIRHIVFVEFPHVMGSKDLYERQQRANRAAELIQEAGFDYIDFTGLGDEIGLDYTKDFYDAHHMLATGQKKFTHYLADILMNDYGLESREQTAENRQQWDESADLIAKYYKVFDEYMRAHADEPYAKAGFLLAENTRTMKEISYAD